MARLRAVETRRYLVRAANTGISGMVDPWGRVMEKTGLDESVVAVANIRPLSSRTLYVRWGDVLPRLCVVLTLLGALLAWRSRVGAPTPTREHPTVPTREQ